MSAKCRAWCSECSEWVDHIPHDINRITAWLDQKAKDPFRELISVGQFGPGDFVTVGEVAKWLQYFVHYNTNNPDPDPPADPFLDAE